MRIPRDLTGDDLVKLLAPPGYQVTRQTGSHMRLTTTEPSQHHLTVPRHNPLRIGTLGAILNDVAAQLEVTREEPAQRLFVSRYQLALPATRELEIFLKRELGRWKGERE